MAILHKATLTPSKDELLNGHVGTIPALADIVGAGLSRIAAYRFDDPAGEVGVETHLLQRDSGPVAQIPLTYRGTPLAGADDWLVDTMDHSVLGKRWVYNACGDPVYVNELLRAILTGGTQVEQYLETDDGPVLVESTARVIGSGTPGTPVPAIDAIAARRQGTDTVVTAGGWELVVRHLIADHPAATGPSLAGNWPGLETPVLLAFIRP